MLERFGRSCEHGRQTAFRKPERSARTHDEAIGRVLERHPGQGMVIGGIAIIARGFERATKDVDVTFSGADVSIATLMDELRSAGVEPRIPNAAEFAATSQVLLLRHATTMVDVDVSRAWLPFELEAIARAEMTKLAGVSLPVARAEDLVIYKMIAWRPRDQQDVEDDGRGRTRIPDPGSTTPFPEFLDRESELGNKRRCNMRDC